MNPRLLVALAALQFVLFPIPTITLFWKDQIGMSLADVMALQAVFGLAVVICEFPSGYLADRVGYRSSLLAGAALWVTGWVLYGLGEGLMAIALAEIVLGAAAAFVSGADRAMLWVSLHAEGRDHEYTRWEGRLRAAAQTSEALSAAVGGWLYARHPRLPIWLQVPTVLVAAGVVAMLREVPRREQAVRRSHLERALSIVRLTLWRHRRLQASLALGVVLGLASFVMVWLIQPLMQARGIPTAWFGLLWAGAHLWLAGVSLASGRVLTALGARATFLVCCALIAAGYLGLAAITSPWSVIFYLCFMTLRGLQGPILATVIQRDAPAEDRASVLSLAALAFRLAFVVAGPPIGALVDRVGMEMALAVLGVLFAGASIVGVEAFIRVHRGREEGTAA